MNAAHDGAEPAHMDSVPRPWRVEEYSADLKLARAALAGDEAARREFILRMGCVARMLWARNRRLATPLVAGELEEVIQRTLVSIWQRLASFAGQSTLETWVCTFCNYNLLAALRERSRRRGNGEPVPESPTEPIEADSERFESLYRALAAARHDDAEILRWKHFDDLTFDQIAHRLGRATSTIKSMYYQALERLRQTLAAKNRAAI